MPNTIDRKMRERMPRHKRKHICQNRRQVHRNFAAAAMTGFLACGRECDYNVVDAALAYADEMMEKLDARYREESKHGNS